MKYLLFSGSFLLSALTTKSQSLEDKLAASACQYIDSINIAKVITSQDKKTAITFIFAKAVAANQTAINNDNRFKGLKNYEQGKKLGQLMAQSILPKMTKNCPKFERLIR